MFLILCSIFSHLNFPISQKEHHDCCNSVVSLSPQSQNGGFILIGAWESLVASSSESLKLNHPPSLPFGTSIATPPTNENQTTKGALSSSSPVTFASIAALSFLFLLNSLISLSDALSSKDHIGFAFQLEVIAIALLFSLYSVLGLLTHIKDSFQLPSALLNVLCLFAFGEEFVFFYV